LRNSRQEHEHAFIIARNVLRLDGRRLGVAHLGQRGDERRGKAETVKIFQVMIFQTAAKAQEIPRGG